MPPSINDAPALAAIFRDPDAREQGTIMFVDMQNATDAKSADVEAKWLTQTGFVYDAVVRAMLLAGAGQIVKFLGDGVMVHYGDDHTTAAINDAIAIQEAIQRGVDAKQVQVAVSIGLATGELVAFDSPSGTRDYLGLTVDRASRLCAAASAQAVFVDAATVASAQMNRVLSEVGKVLRRSIEEYHGQLQRTPLKGFPEPVPYHEILWGPQYFGLKSDVMTATVGPSRPAGVIGSVAPRPVTAAAKARPPKAQRGTVKRALPDRKAFIDGDDGVTYFTDGRYAVSGDDDLCDGDVVWFVVLPSPGDSRCPIAAAALAVDQIVDGTLVSMGDTYGWIRVADPRGNAQDVFVARTIAPADARVGERLEFMLSEASGRSRAEDVGRPGEDEREAA